MSKKVDSTDECHVSNADLLRGLEAVRDNRRFWPLQEHFEVAHQIIPVPASEVAIVKNGKLLMHYRLFKEWGRHNTPDKKYDNPGWYIPGGYMDWEKDMRSTAIDHIEKDLMVEYGRVNVKSDFSSIVLSEPVVIATKKWMPGDHPFGVPVSVLCVCELVSGEIIETDRLKWSDKTIPTPVPWHRSFQDAVFAYIDSSELFKAQLRLIQSSIDTVL